jgi:hypothetical protein
MFKLKDEPLTESELGDLKELFRVLPDCAKEYFRNNPPEKVQLYFEGFHDGAEFIIDFILPRLTKIIGKP